MSKLQILIQYDNSDDAMYGGDTTDGEFVYYPMGQENETE